MSTPTKDHLGKTYVSMTAMAKAYGLTYMQLKLRLCNEWTLERALTTPIKPYGRVR